MCQTEEYNGGGAQWFAIRNFQNMGSLKKDNKNYTTPLTENTLIRPKVKSPLPSAG